MKTGNGKKIGFGRGRDKQISYDNLIIILCLKKYIELRKFVSN